MQLAAENMVQLLFAFQGAFFFLLTVSRRRLRPFSLLLATFALHMGSNLLAETGQLPESLNFTSSFGFLYGPLFFLFIRELTSRDPSADVKALAHGLPFLVSLAFPVGATLLKIGVAISLLAYGFLTYQYLRQYRNALQDTVADTETGRADWINKAAAALGFLAIYDAIRLSAPQVIPVSEQLQYLITLVSAFFLINWLIFKTMQFPDLFWGLSEEEKQTQGEDNQAGPEPLSDTEQAQLNSVLDLFEAQEMFLNPHLRLSDLASKAGQDGRTISRLILRSTGDRFAAFVNRRRIEEAKKLISNSQRPINFLKTSYEAGFNSKSAFNAAFKQFEGITPSEFRNEKGQKTS